MLLACLAGCVARGPVCAPKQVWVDPATLRAVGDPVPRAAAIVLLGERHDVAADHAWQLATIEALARRGPIVLGFEMFPRRAQPVLDRWVAGQLSEADFLRQTDWQRVWGFDPGLYLPIFRWARDHRVPMMALNVGRAFVHHVAQRGFAAVPVGEREGVGAPAPAAPGYRAMLAEAMGGHQGSAPPERFIEAQQTWDRAMAEALASARARYPGHTIVGLMGAGHVEHRWGVPWQLAALGAGPVSVFVPVSELCAPASADFADAVWSE